MVDTIFHVLVEVIPLSLQDREDFRFHAGRDC
jgi:hypothetical protein